jgi:hypothetical protein
MDFLNDIENDNSKDNNSIFTFNDKNDTAQKASLPFPFISQSFQDGKEGEVPFFNNDGKSLNESFSLGQTGGDNQNNNNNISGFDFLNTICEVPESSNNLFNSQSDNGFLTSNIPPNQGGLDFINEDENENNNFDFEDNKEMINVNINNLFKSSQKKNEDIGNSSKSRKNQNYELNNLLNIGNDDMNIKPKENEGKFNSQMKNIIQKNNTNDILNNDDDTNKKQFIESNQDNKSINQNNEISSISNQNKFGNMSFIPNDEKLITNNNMNINSSTLTNTPQNVNKSINYKAKETTPSLDNISIKPKLNKKTQKINLDDIDKIISLNVKNDNRDININANKNALLNNQGPIKGRQDSYNNLLNIDFGKENLKNFSNEISNILNSTLINGKRSEIEQKDKDLQNIDNLLNFKKENITPKTEANNKNQNLLKIENNKNTFKKSNNFPKTNPIQLNQIPDDSFDKKSQIIKLEKNDDISLTQMGTSSKNMPIEDGKKHGIPTKYEIIQRYNNIAMRLNKIREKAKEYRNLAPFFSQLITANENYKTVYPNALKKLLEEYNEKTTRLCSLMKLKNNKMSEMNYEFFEEIKKCSLTFPDKLNY